MKTEAIKELNSTIAKRIMKLKVVDRFGPMIEKPYEEGQKWPKPIVDEQGNHFKIGEHGSYFYQHEDSEDFCHLWNPSDPTSGQIFLVLDAMRKIGFEIKLDFDLHDFDVDIFYDDYLISSGHTIEYSKRNEIILKTILIALDKKEG